MKRNTHRRFANFMELQQPWTLHWILSKKAQNIYLAKGIRRKIIIKRPSTRNQRNVLCALKRHRWIQCNTIRHPMLSELCVTLCRKQSVNEENHKFTNYSQGGKDGKKRRKKPTTSPQNVRQQKHCGSAMTKWLCLTQSARQAGGNCHSTWQSEMKGSEKILQRKTLQMVKRWQKVCFS